MSSADQRLDRLRQIYERVRREALADGVLSDSERTRLAGIEAKLAELERRGGAGGALASLALEVVRAGSGAPVAGAEITLEGSAGRMAARAGATDAQGVCVFDGLPEGVYAIAARTADAAAAEEVRVEGRLHHHRLVLAAPEVMPEATPDVAPDVTPGVPEAAPEAAPPPPPPESPRVQRSLSGAVGSGGRNQPDDVTTVQELLNRKGASLTVDGLVGPATIGAISSFQREALGFADGRVDPGGRTWEAMTEGGAPEAASPAGPGQPASAPPPAPGAPARPGAPSPGGLADAEGAIEVRVEDAAGTPVEEVVVKLSTGPTWRPDTRTDKRGLVLFEGISPGRYHINAAKRDRVWQPAVVEGRELARGGTETVTLRSSRQVNEAGLVTFSVEVTAEPDLAPVPGATVVVKLVSNAGVQRSGTTNASGLMVAPDLPPGSYRVEVSTGAAFRTAMFEILAEHAPQIGPFVVTMPAPGGAAEEEGPAPEGLVDGAVETAEGTARGARGSDPMPDKEHWFNAEASVGTGFGTLKLGLDGNGKVTRVIETEIIPGVSRAIPAPPLVLNVSVDFLKAEVEFADAGDYVDVKLVYNCGGSGFVGFGSVLPGGFGGAGVQVELKASTPAIVSGQVRKAEATTSTAAEMSAVGFNRPAVVTLSGTRSLVIGVKGEEGQAGWSFPTNTYPNMLKVHFSSKADRRIEVGPDFGRFVADLTDFIDSPGFKLLAQGYRMLDDETKRELDEALEDKLNDPFEDKPETEGKVKEVDYQKIVDNAKKAAEDARQREAEQERQAQLDALRGLEADVRSKCALIYGGGSVAARSNSLAQTDPEKNKRIYGSAWTAAAQGKMAWDGYAPPPDSAPANVLSAKTVEVIGIQSKFVIAITNFGLGDSQN